MYYFLCVFSLTLTYGCLSNCHSLSECEVSIVYYVSITRIAILSYVIYHVIKSSFIEILDILHLRYKL